MTRPIFLREKRAATASRSTTGNVSPFANIDNPNAPIFGPDGYHEPSTSTFSIARHNAPNKAVQFGTGSLYGGHQQPVTSPDTPASQGGPSAPAYDWVVTQSQTDYPVTSSVAAFTGLAFPAGPSETRHRFTRVRRRMRR